MITGMCSSVLFADEVLESLGRPIDASTVHRSLTHSRDTRPRVVEVAPEDELEAFLREEEPAPAPVAARGARASRQDQHDELVQMIASLQTTMFEGFRDINDRVTRIETFLGVPSPFDGASSSQPPPE